MARARTNPETAAARDKPTLPAQSTTVNDQDIARRAYDLFLARGCEPGRDVEDWLQAERELREATRPAGAPRLPRA